MNIAVGAKRIRSAAPPILIEDCPVPEPEIFFILVSTSQISQGAPIIAITAPTGISPRLLRTIRASVSANVISSAPQSALAGMSRRCLRIPLSRTRWGATRPTKPMGPTTLTTIAAISTDMPRPAARVKPTRCPRERAVDSSSSSASNCLPPSSEIPSRTMTKGQAY
ncbi:hypothetical protein D3C73_1220070 [compost metagenome]